MKTRSVRQMVSDICTHGLLKGCRDDSTQTYFKPHLCVHVIRLRSPMVNYLPMVARRGHAKQAKEIAEHNASQAEVRSNTLRTQLQHAKQEADHLNASDEEKVVFCVSHRYCCEQTSR